MPLMNLPAGIWSLLPAQTGRKTLLAKNWLKRKGCASLYFNWGVKEKTPKEILNPFDHHMRSFVEKSMHKSSRSKRAICYAVQLGTGKSCCQSIQIRHVGQ